MQSKIFLFLIQILICLESRIEYNLRQAYSYTKFTQIYKNLTNIYTITKVDLDFFPKRQEYTFLVA